QYVVLVDPRRNDQQRSPIDFARRRSILDQLEQVVLKYDLAGRDGYVHAQLEGVLVGHAHADLLASAALEILEQVVQSPQQVLAAARYGCAQHFRIGRDEVGGRKRVYVLAGVELDFARGALVEPRDVAEGAMQVLRRYEIGLLDVVEGKELLPILVLEAAVALRRLDHRLHRLAHQPQHRVLPQRGVILPELQLRFGKLQRVGEQSGPRLEECLGN